MSEYAKYTTSAAAGVVIIYNALKLTNELLDAGEGCKKISYIVGGTTILLFNHIYPSKVLLAVGALSTAAWYIPGRAYQIRQNQQGNQ